MLFTIMTSVGCRKDAAMGNVNGEANYFRSVLNRYVEQKNDGSSEKKMLGAIEDMVDWGNAHVQREGDLSVTSFDIKDKGLKMSKPAARRIIFFPGKNGQMDFKFVELFGNVEAVTFSKAIGSIFSNEDDSSGIKGIVYNHSYLPLRNIEQRVPVAVVKGERSSSATSHNSSQTGPVASSVQGCQEWGVFLVTRDGNGNIIEEELLYTYSVGSCSFGTSTEDQQAPDYGGGEVDDDALAEFMDEYAEVQSENTIVSQPALEDNTINEGFNIWTAVTGGGGSWKIRAITEYGFKRYPFWTTSMRKVHEYDIVKYKTVSTYFIGWNNAVQSTWTARYVWDRVENNKSAKARGRTSVVGTVEHTSKLNPAPTYSRVSEVTGEFTLVPA